MNLKKKNSSLEVNKKNKKNTDFPARGRPSGVVVWTLLRTEQQLAKCSLYMWLL